MEDDADPALSHWVKAQRRANRSERILDKRKQILDELGVDWTIEDEDSTDAGNASIWNSQVEKLKTYRELNGDCKVRNGALEYWISFRLLGNLQQLQHCNTVGTKKL